MKLHQIKRLLENIERDYRMLQPSPLVVLHSRPTSNLFPNGEVECSGNTPYKGYRFNSMEQATQYVEDTEGPIVIVHLHPTEDKITERDDNRCRQGYNLNPVPPPPISEEEKLLQENKPCRTM